MTRAANNRNMKEQVASLVNTSVDDMQSGLWGYLSRDLDLLKRALLVVKRRGEKTKARILQSKINQLKRN